MGKAFEALVWALKFTLIEIVIFSVLYYLYYSVIYADHNGSHFTILSYQLFGRLMYLQLIIQIIFLTLLSYFDFERNFILMIALVAASCSISGYISYHALSSFIKVFSWNEARGIQFGLVVLISSTIAYIIMRSLLMKSS